MSNYLKLLKTAMSNAEKKRQAAIRKNLGAERRRADKAEAELGNLKAEHAAKVGLPYAGGMTVEQENKLRNKYRQIIGKEYGNMAKSLLLTQAGRLGWHLTNGIGAGLRLFGKNNAADWLNGNGLGSRLTRWGINGLGTLGGIYLGNKAIDFLDKNKLVTTDQTTSILNDIMAGASSPAANEAAFNNLFHNKGYTYEDIDKYLDRTSNYIDQKYGGGNTLLRGIAGTIGGQVSSDLAGGGLKGFLASVPGSLVGSVGYDFLRDKTLGVRDNPLPLRYYRVGDKNGIMPSNWGHIGRIIDDYGPLSWIPGRYLWHPYAVEAPRHGKNGKGKYMTNEEIGRYDIARSEQLNENINKYNANYNRVRQGITNVANNVATAANNAASNFNKAVSTYSRRQPPTSFF